MGHLWHTIHPGTNAPTEVRAIIEIPAGSKVKYEIDKQTGVLWVDRILHSSVVYPANYGFIPQTLRDDNDPLDVLVLMQEPVAPLSVLLARPIGMLNMLDEGQADEKIVAVHVHDPQYAEIHDIEQLPHHRLRELRRFFVDYKALEDKLVEVDGVVGPERAHAIIEFACARYLERRDELPGRDVR